MGQEGSPSVPQASALPRAAVSPSDAHQELLDRLLKMEQRLDQVTKRNEELFTGGPGAQGGESGPASGVPCGTRCNAVQRNPGRRHRQLLAAERGGRVEDLRR